MVNRREFVFDGIGFEKMRVAMVVFVLTRNYSGGKEMENARYH
jgi:hypothetical protein